MRCENCQRGVHQYHRNITSLFVLDFSIFLILIFLPIVGFDLIKTPLLLLHCTNHLHVVQADIYLIFLQKYAPVY